MHRCKNKHTPPSLGPRSRVDRPLSSSRKASVEERDPEEMACKVRQAIQRENQPVLSPELFSRNTVHLPHIVFSRLLLLHTISIYDWHLFSAFFASRPGDTRWGMPQDTTAPPSMTRMRIVLLWQCRGSLSWALGMLIEFDADICTVWYCFCNWHL